MNPLKMYFLLKMVIFHCYVSLPEGKFLEIPYDQSQTAKSHELASFDPEHANSVHASKIWAPPLGMVL